MTRPRVLLADDHRIVIEGLRGLLETEFDLVGTAEDGRAMLAAAEALTPDVIVADISMPLLNGIEAARQLRSRGSTARVVFLTMHPDLAYATRAFEAGAMGYVLKHAASSELVTAIREALAGRAYVSPAIDRNALDTALTRGGDPRGERSVPAELTPRQREVLQLVAEGRSAKQIASILGISSRTVEFHKYQMMRDLDLRTTAELIQYAIRHGFVSV